MQRIYQSYLQTSQNANGEGAGTTRSTTQNKIKPTPVRKKVFENFPPYCIKEWSKLNEKTRNIESINKFNEKIFNFLRPKRNSVFYTHNTKGIKPLFHLRLKFSRLNDDKFRYNL